MMPVTQSRVGEDGTCFRACIASILDLKESQVTDFDKAGDGSEDAYWDAVQDFLAGHGLKYRRAPIAAAKPSGYSTIEGISPRGGLHACVALDGKLVHDPHPPDGTGRGLVEPRYYGLFEPVTRANDAVSTKLDELRKKEAAAFRRVMKAFAGSPRQKELHEQWQAIRTEYLAERKRTKTTDRADMTRLRRNTERQGGPFFVQETEKDGTERTIPIRALRKY